MIRGLKKKLLIGLLSATVVGTSLAPNVPLVGSFAQEVKAAGTKTDKDGNVYEEVTIKAEATYSWPADLNDKVTYEKSGDNYNKLSALPTAEEGKSVYTLEGTDEPVSVDVGTTNVSGYYSESGNNYEKTSDTTAVDNKEYYDIRENEVLAEPTYSWPSDTTNYYTIDANGTATQVTGTDATIGTISPGANATVTVYKKLNTSDSSVSVTVKDKVDNAATDNPGVDGTKITGTHVKQGNETQVTDMTGKAEAGFVVKKGIETIIQAYIKDLPTGKKLKEVKATYPKNGVTNTVEGAIGVDGKTITFNLGQVVDNMVIEIEATVEDVKIEPTLNTSRLKGATAAFSGTTAVNQADGKLTVVVTPTESKYLNDLKDAITVKEKDGDNFGGPTVLDGKLVFESTGNGFKSDKPVIVVEGGLANKGSISNGKDLVIYDTPADIEIDANDVLAAYKALHPDSDKNDAVSIKAELLDGMPGVFEEAYKVEKIINDKIEKGISIKLTVKGGQSASAAAQATEANATDDINEELKTPIKIRVTLPLEAQGKGGYIVYREHDGNVEKIDSFTIDGNDIVISTTKLSQFTVLYDITKTDGSKGQTDDNNGENNNGENNNNEDNGSNSSSSSGTTATTSTAKAATTTKAAKATTSTKKSSKTSSPKTADYAVNSLLALLTGAAGLFGITLINKKRKEDEE
ncbi:hypothetical protein [Lachnobacterium bovis]|uniref:hypothetical protein n=1 Tax=Lachnobacterium bovis TaxID=140626 RepID=UPI00048F5833|nr:hypothetical protein [Lachnobacterium bovis]